VEYSSIINDNCIRHIHPEIDDEIKSTIPNGNFLSDFKDLIIFSFELFTFTSFAGECLYGPNISNGFFTNLTELTLFTLYLNTIFSNDSTIINDE